MKVRLSVLSRYSAIKIIMGLLLATAEVRFSYAQEAMALNPNPIETYSNESNKEGLDKQGKQVTVAPGLENLQPQNPSQLTPSHQPTVRIPPKIKYIRKSFYTTLGLGLSSVHYNEEGVPNYSAIALIGKFSVRIPMQGRWDAGGSMNMTLMPIVQSPSGNAARFLGVNFRAGYAPAFVKSPFRLSLLGGVYYTRMFVSGNIFGFYNMFGPQFFPVLHRAFSKGDSIMFYGKFSPVTSNFRLLTLENREMAIGSAYAFRPSPKGTAYILSLDFTNMKLRVRNIGASTNAITLSLAISLP